MTNNSISQYTKTIISTLKYDKESYSLLYCFIFIIAIFENFFLFAKLNLADVLGFSMAMVFFITKFDKIDVSPYVIPIGFVIIAIIDFSLYNALSILGSQMRFVFNCLIYTILYSYFKVADDQAKEIFISSYIYVCVLFSVFVICQFFSYYVLHYNLAFDFGDYQAAINAASYYDPSQGGLYRTGGLFKEPSWFAVFIGPVLEIAYSKKKYAALMICLLGIVFSTSSLGWLSIFIFLLFRISKHPKSLFRIVLLILLIYLFFPVAFSRLFDAVGLGDGGNTNDVRVVTPFETILQGNYITLFGANISPLIEDRSIFLNTFLFVPLAFGLLGFILFCFILLYNKSMCLKVTLLVTVIVEGCYGRMDFWMALLAASVYASTPIGMITEKYETNDSTKY